MKPTWDDLVAEAMEHFLILQDVLPPPDPEGTWQGDSLTGEFLLLDGKGELTVRARMQFVGSFSTMSNSFLWGWANPTGSLEEREQLAQRLRVFGERHGFELLTQGRVPCDEALALKLFAVGVHVLRAEAWYRFPLAATSTGYLALFDVEVQKR
ncbi:MAG: hypothetical protein QM817_15480 [Archangium sp.]